MNKKGFTLIELLAVIVIMAVLALIAIPIAINIINDSRENVHKRSIENYGRKVEEAYLEAKMNGGSVPNTLEELEKIVPIKTSGEKVVCDKNIDIVDQENEKITLTNCYVAEEGNDQKQKSKYKYNYINGKAEKIDSEEENNNDTNENNNNKEYTIGEEISLTNHNNEKYYVIGQGDDYVTLLKQEPLTFDEVNTYGGAGTGNSHVNRYADYSVGTAYNFNGYGGIVYYSSPTCGYIDRWDEDRGCTNSYDDSEIKHVLEAWAGAKFNNELKTDGQYAVRLIELSEIQQFYPSCNLNSAVCKKESTTPQWLYNSNYGYWTMTQYYDAYSGYVWYINSSGDISRQGVYSATGAVRPVINIKKSAIN